MLRPWQQQRCDHPTRQIPLRKRLAIAVQVNDRSNVTSFQSFPGNSLSQNHSVMFHTTNIPELVPGNNIFITSTIITVKAGISNPTPRERKKSFMRFILA